MADPFGTIVGIIDLLDKAKKAYDKFKDAKDLPKAFGTISGQIDLATSIFKDVERSTGRSAQTDKIRGTVEQCKLDAEDLNAIYQEVHEHMHGSWRDRYKSYVASMTEGRKCKVETIWKRILDGVRLLADDFEIHKLDEIMNAIKDIEQLPNSLEESKEGSVHSTVHGNAVVSGVHNGNIGDVTMGNRYGGSHIENHGKPSDRFHKSSRERRP